MAEDEDRLVIAIDGPSGAGKSSTSRGVADQLDLHYLDTGSMYRAFTLGALQRDVAADDAAAISELIEHFDLDVYTDPVDFAVFLDGQDVTAKLHSTHISGQVSAYAKLPPVRELLTDQMRQIIDSRGRIVVEGRDITTVVAPDAQVRVLLVADAQRRIERRAAELGDASADVVSQQVVGRDAADSEFSEFLTPADGVVVIDSTELSLDEVIAAVIDLVPPQLLTFDEDDLEPVVEYVDQSVLDDDYSVESFADDYELRPVVAVVGRPNVGKSTLVNRILGRREAVVQDVPGVTRDRVSYDAEWAGRQFVLVDTGGWASNAKGMAAQIAEQAEIAISLADAVIFVVDATVGIMDEDEAVVRVLRRSNKPVVLAANKVDGAEAEAEAAAMWNLGLGEPYAISALHGRGSGDLLDAVIAALPEEGSVPPRDVGGPRRVAIVGKPNVGKSSLLNQLSGQNRSVVSDVSGTTVDPVDEVVEIAGQDYRLIDTAGIRRRVKEASGSEYYAWLRTQSAIERAECCVVVIDSAEEISEQDLKLLDGVAEAGRAMVIAYNKWDLIDDERRYYLNREIERDLHAWGWAPSVNISALTGRNVEKLARAIETSLDGWSTRISTGQLNAFLGRTVAAQPHPVRGGKQPRILFGTQAATEPPTFILFTTGDLDAQYVRFVERRLREEFGFEGSPVRVQVRARAKRKDR